MGLCLVGGGEAALVGEGWVRCHAYISSPRRR